MAGLAAARHLLREGRVNVTLLEARNRVGGRVLSVYNSQSDSLSPGAGEMGATWFHGTRGNAAYNAATQYALHAPRGAGSTRTPGAKGRKNTYVTIDLERGEIEGRAAQEIGATCRSVSDLVEDASGGDSIYRGFEELGDIDVGPLVRGGALSFPKERAAAQACLLACNIEGCHSLRLLGPPGDYKELRGGNVRLPGGMGRLTSALAQEVEERGGALRLGCAVARIRWDGQRVRITTEDGEELDADAAVCTLPLGVLKERALDSPTALSCVDGVAGVLRPGVAAEAAAAPAAPLFEPTLPQDKQGAIARIGAGNSNKVVLQFAPDAGWQLEHEGYTLLQPTQLARFAPLAGVEDIASMSMTASGAGGSTDTVRGAVVPATPASSTTVGVLNPLAFAERGSGRRLAAGCVRRPLAGAPVAGRRIRAAARRSAHGRLLPHRCVSARGIG